MMRYLSAILSVVALFMFASCSKENGEVVEDNAPSSYTVEYFVVLNSPGTVKITYKDPSGQEIVEPSVGAPTVGTTWEKVFDFGDSVDSKFLVELSDDGPDDPVGVEMYIAVNDDRVQKATKFITRNNTMELGVKRP